MARYAPILTAVSALALGSFAVGAQAQVTSLSDPLSGSVSDPLLQSTSQSGFNSAFDASTSSFTNPNNRADVSDPTHSQLLGSTLSPADTAYANASTDTAPRTGAQTDAQSVVGMNDFTFGGRRSRLFAASSAERYSRQATSRQESLGNTGAYSMQAAFAGGVDARAAFSGQTVSNRGTQLGFSGEGVNLPTVETGPGTIEPLASTGAPDPSAAYLAIDPILTDNHSGWGAGPELHGDMPQPSTQTGGFFAEGSAPVAGYEFDDGQTPLHGGGVGTPGQILGYPPESQPPSTGFPDSTRNLAGLPMESGGQNPISSRAASLNASPFAPVSEGGVYEPRTRLNPSLHAATPEVKRGSFDAYEHRLEELRLSHGMSISQASSAREQDRRAFDRTGGRLRRRPTLLQPKQATNGYQPELMGTPVVR